MGFLLEFGWKSGAEFAGKRIQEIAAVCLLTAFGADDGINLVGGNFQGVGHVAPVLMDDYIVIFIGGSHFACHIVQANADGFFAFGAAGTQALFQVFAAGRAHENAHCGGVLFQNLQASLHINFQNQVVALLQLFLLSFATLIIKYIGSLKREHENNLLAMADRQQMSYLRSRIEEDTEIRKLHHDMKNQLLALQNSFSEERQKRNITDLLNDLESFDVSISTGNTLIDSLISSKIMDCKKAGIQISIILDLKQLSFIRDVDLIRIIGNALDNAIEATAEAEKDRLIRIISENAANYYIIHVINPYKGSRKFEDGLPVTTKGDRTFHGMGLKNIQKVVESYQGRIHINTKENGIFHLSIMIPLPAKQEDQ